MASGDLINFNNINSLVGTDTLTQYTVSEDSSGNLNRTVFMAGQVAYITTHVQTWGVFASASMTLNAYYYNGSSWVLGFNRTWSVSGIEGGDDYTDSHNYFANKAYVSYHLWKLVYTSSHSGSNYSLSSRIYIYGFPKLNSSSGDASSIYNSYYKGSKIKYCDIGVYTGISESDFLAAHRPSHFRGNQITSANAKYLGYTPLD